MVATTIEHYLKACAGKPDCTEMKMNWVISMSKQSGFPTLTPVLCVEQDLAQLNINLCSRMKICTDFTLVSLHIVTVSTDDHSLLDHLVWH